MSEGVPFPFRARRVGDASPARVESPFAFRAGDDLYVGGSFVLPTPCHAPDLDRVRGGKPGEIWVEATSTASDDSFCIQVVSRRLHWERFPVSGKVSTVTMFTIDGPKVVSVGTLPDTHAASAAPADAGSGGAGDVAGVLPFVARVDAAARERTRVEGSSGCGRWVRAALADARVRLRIARKLSQGHVFRGIDCVPAGWELVAVVFRFERAPGVFCLVPPAFAAIVNQVVDVVESIRDPWIDGRVAPPRATAATGAAPSCRCHEGGARPGSRCRGEFVVVHGTLRTGIACSTIDTGAALWSFAGDRCGLPDGTDVWAAGFRADASICMEGTPIDVVWIGTASPVDG